MESDYDRLKQVLDDKASEPLLGPRTITVQQGNSFGHFTFSEDGELEDFRMRFDWEAWVRDRVC